MTNTLQNEYRPDYISPPGDTLTINEIIQKKAAITAETALQLEQVLGIPASFWLKREQNYRESLARLVEGQRLESWGSRPEREKRI